MLFGRFNAPTELETSCVNYQARVRGIHGDLLPLDVRQGGDGRLDAPKRQPWALRRSTTG
jgi:hypothetical protein